jgi:hypothetical protein
MGQQIKILGGPEGPARPDTAVALARAIGTPPTKQLADTPVLVAQETQMLQRCEAALENMRLAFWAAGKALQVVRDARLYRATHDRFEDYSLERWDITPQYAGKLIRAWKIAETVFESVAGKSNDLETVVSRRLGYAQTWALVPLAEEHSADAAALLYLALIKERGAAVTTELVAGAVEALPDDAAGHRRKTEEAVRLYLKELDDREKPVAGVNPVKAFRALTRMSRAVDAQTLEAAMAHDPERTRQAARALIETLSASTGITVVLEPEPAPELETPEAAPTAT